MRFHMYSRETFSVGSSRYNDLNPRRYLLRVQKAVTPRLFHERRCPRKILFEHFEACFSLRNIVLKVFFQATPLVPFPRGSLFRQFVFPTPHPPDAVERSPLEFLCPRSLEHLFDDELELPPAAASDVFLLGPGNELSRGGDLLSVASATP